MKLYVINYEVIPSAIVRRSICGYYSTWYLITEAIDKVKKPLKQIIVV